ncbi:hypothetical protein EJ110_NYTH33793 [Nymphaea thermarum]|nr:hypothetical protein EJ110_NYTH33793 [Nymphaea thermarum]
MASLCYSPPSLLPSPVARSPSPPSHQLRFSRHPFFPETTNALGHVAEVTDAHAHRSRCVLAAFSRSSSSTCRTTTQLQQEEIPHHAFDSIVIADAVSDSELWATTRLRVECFYPLDPTVFAVEDQRRYLSEREFEALKERAAASSAGSNRVACINATIPLSELPKSFHDLRSKCKFSSGGEDRVVIGTLDLNQTMRLADELVGRRPEGIGADFARAYLSNVCVAKELQRKGIAYALMDRSKKIAREWGISDLYVHVAADNEAAKKLYSKSGFVYESDEPAWQARFLGRPRRILLWFGLSNI